MGPPTGISTVWLMPWQVLNLIKELLDRMCIRNHPHAQASMTSIIQTSHLKGGWVLSRLGGAASCAKQEQGKGNEKKGFWIVDDC
jgi:hypothetical protein